MVNCKSFYRQITSSEPISSMAMVPPRSLPKLGALGAMEKCLWFISMKFGDNDNAMGGMVDCKSLYHQTTSSEPISSMAMVPSRSLPKVGAFEAMEKCLWSISMKFGDNNNAMLVLSIASPSTAKPQVQSLYHPWLWSPRGLYQNWERLELWKSVFGPYP